MKLPRRPVALRILGRLVPRPLREDWLTEWTAEWVVARAAENTTSRGGRRGSPSVLLAAGEDALTLRLRQLRQAGATADLRYAARSLAARPGFVAVVVVTLGLGIGATVGIASAVRGVLLRPLPWDDPDRIVRIATAFHGGFEAPVFSASILEFLDLQEEHPGFREIAAYVPTRSNLGRDGEPLRVGRVQGTPDLLTVLGADAVVGRVFLESEGRPGADRVALLTHGLWTQAFGGDAAAVGSTIRIDELAHRVVGILAPDFEFPGGEVDVLTALRVDRANTGGRGSHWVYMLGRLREGVDLERARATTADLIPRWQERYAGQHTLDPEGHPLVLEGVREVVVGDMDGPLLILAGAVFLVLLVACFNVANLLLVRGEDRSREFGVRAALGAGRGRVVRQLLVESGLLALAGGLLGLVLAAGALQLLPELADGALPPNATLALDGSVLAVAGALVVGVTLLFGLLPTFGAGGDVARVLRAGGVRSTAHRGRLAFRRVLVVGEVAAAVALIAGAGVLARGFANILAVDPGFDREGVLLFDLELPPAKYATAGEAAAFHRELRERAEALPGVRAVGTVRSPPLSGDAPWESVSLPGEAAPSADESAGWTVQYQVVDPGFLEALGLPVLSGRAIADTDGAGRPLVAIVNRTAARGLWGDRDPIGREVRLGPPPPAGPNPPLTVVGVVADVRQAALDEDPPPQLFVTRAQAGSIYGGLGASFATVLVRTDGDPMSTLPALRDLVREMDPRLPIASPRTLEQQVVRSVGDRRLLAALMGLFSVVAAVLGAVGLYGLVSYVVTRRSREIGIRYALGAGRARVVRRIVGEACGLVLVGSVLGVALAVAGGGVLEGFVFGIGPRDPTVLAGAPLLLLVVGLLAAWVPARRASTVAPAEVLRQE